MTADPMLRGLMTEFGEEYVVSQCGADDEIPWAYKVSQGDRHYLVSEILLRYAKVPLKTIADYVRAELARSLCGGTRGDAE